MSRYFICLAILICSTMFITGCTNQPIRTTMVYSPDTHLIFNPNWTGIPATDVARAIWPTTTTFRTSSENIKYRETTIDIQGLSGFNSDRTYRRFRSTRTGNRDR